MSSMRFVDYMLTLNEGRFSQGVIDGTNILNSSLAPTGEAIYAGYINSLLRAVKNFPNAVYIHENKVHTVYSDHHLLKFDENEYSLKGNSEIALGMFPWIVCFDELKNFVMPTTTINLQKITSMGYAKLYKFIEENKDLFNLAMIDDTLSRWGDIGKFQLATDDYWNDEAKEILMFQASKTADIEMNDLIINLVKWYQVEDASLLSGPTSSGKTTIYSKIASILNLPFYVQNFDKDTDPDKILGTFLPKKDSEGFEFVESPFVKAFRDGGFYLADEINFAGGDITAVFHSALDGQAQILLPTKEVVKKHPLFRMGAGINEQYSGTKPLNIAFLRRLKRKDRLSSMSAEVMINMAKAKFAESINDGSISEKHITKMAEVIKKIENKYEKEQVRDASVGVTHLFSWISMYCITQDWLSSALSTVVNLSCEDADVNNEVYKNIILTNALK